MVVIGEADIDTSSKSRNNGQSVTPIENCKLEDAVPL